MHFYLVPILRIGDKRGPKYFYWRLNPDGIYCSWSIMDYGFFDYCLLLSRDISDADHNTLILNPDVWLFPDNLDSPVSQDIQPFFESINIPVDWLTPSTTYRELLRQVGGMFQFNQRYGGISNGHSLFENATLSTRVRQLLPEEQAWFLLTVESFGFDSSLINLNSQLSLLVKQAASYWDSNIIILGGIEI